MTLDKHRMQIWKKNLLEIFFKIFFVEDSVAFKCHIPRKKEAVLGTEFHESNKN